MPESQHAAMTNLAWSIALAVVGILGIYLAGSKNLWGWAVSFGAQAAWIVFALITAQYGFILSALAYGFVYGRNYLRWRTERPEKPRRPVRSLRTEWRLALRRDRERRILAEVARIRAERGYPDA